ncbi:cytochrome P450 monooxygenase [Infundibulicybe gibba]|nr:cytochrome P450 monooxygenase [Infundibulicybe gibba]
MYSLPDIYHTPDLSTLAFLVPAAVVLAHLIPYFLDPHGIRLYPGPFLAKFSDIWLGWVAKQGHRSEVVHKMHQKYGPFVRIAPNHVSIAEPDALSLVYAHGNGALKSEFYDAFVSIQRGIVSHIFSQKSVVEFEPQIRLYVSILLQHGIGSVILRLKECGWRGEGGRLWLDCLPWANYLAFDIVGDLAFGAPFGMLENARDSAVVPKDPKAVMDSYGTNAAGEVKEIPAVRILNGRGEFSMSMGSLPPRWRPIVRHLPGFRQGQKDVKALAGIAIMAVAKRLATPTDRVDLLSKLKEGRDSNGNPMGRGELTAEALTLLIAGSDTTSNSTCAILKLQKELDEQLETEDELTATGEQVKRLPFLDACINEGLRIHSTSALGLPRVVPEGGITVLGQYFPEGTVLSVPSYSIHRDPTVWGEDVEAYRPERWFEQDSTAIQKTFNPFSVGPRACVGRNLAFLELQIIVASIMRRYHIVLENPDQPLETREGFLRKPLGCKVGIKRRDLL